MVIAGIDTPITAEIESARESKGYFNRGSFHGRLNKA